MMIRPSGVWPLFPHWPAPAVWVLTTLTGLFLTHAFLLPVARPEEQSSLHLGYPALSLPLVPSYPSWLGTCGTSSSKPHPTSGLGQLPWLYDLWGLHSYAYLHIYLIKAWIPHQIINSMNGETRSAFCSFHQHIVGAEYLVHKLLNEWMLIWRWVSALDQELCAKKQNKSGDIMGAKGTEEGSRKFLWERWDKRGAIAGEGLKGNRGRAKEAICVGSHPHWRPYKRGPRLLELFYRTGTHETDPTIRGLRELSARLLQLELCDPVYGHLQRSSFLQGLEFPLLGEKAEWNEDEPRQADFVSHSTNIEWVSSGHSMRFWSDKSMAILSLPWEIFFLLPSLSIWILSSVDTMLH